MTPKKIDSQFSVLKSIEQQLDHTALSQYISSKIRNLRQKSKLSQAELAIKTGIPLRTYKRLEITGAGTIENLCKVLIALELTAGLVPLFERQHVEIKPVGRGMQALYEAQKRQRDQ